ncbi:hypothetical protein [Cylindrospermopsis raciborskii]|uniref:Uncharacterized protein n=3 Tax=Cylindrospermopsis raciborskii TaxID=77022 RepID=A0A853MD59_9CYAN|nr:hypothetical protein [Cylindrospermopsis raciborskii]OBU75457.1 hypothetical protein A9P98_03375 [Cylindrospermopsis raciborskii CS-505]
MKPNQKKKGTSPGQLKLFWDELDITNEEIIKAATIFVKANCYTPNPKNKSHIPHPQLSGREITEIKIKVSIKINIEGEKSIRETVNQQKCHQNLFSISSNKNSHYPER